MERKCYGITSFLNLKRCQRKVQGRYPYCNDHKRQPLYFVLSLLMSIVIALVTTSIQPKLNSSDIKEVRKKDLLFRFTDKKWQKFKTNERGEINFARSFEVVNNGIYPVNISEIRVSYSVNNKFETSYHNFTFPSMVIGKGVERSKILTLYLNQKINPENIKLNKIIVFLTQSKDSIVFSNFIGNRGVWQ